MAEFKNMKGTLSIDSENMFPIIKKWLYQDHDIFYRELVSNGCDAVTKLKKLSLIGEYEAPEGEKYRIDVRVNPDEKTIAIEDNGIGMTAEEVDKYIDQVAFSGASDFLKTYKDKASEDQIIGHFGLGFYSAFMVADKVTIDTLSYKPDSAPVHWESESGVDFEMTEGSKQGHGTIITLYMNEDSLQFCNEYKAKEVLDKYCSFMPVEIYLHDVIKEAEAAKKAEEEAAKKAEEAAKKAAEGGNASDKAAEADSSASDSAAESTEKAAEPESEKPAEPKPVNDTAPLWNENPSKVTEEQYKEFYRKLFNDYREPLFWIHLNMDYPFNLKGILYFPQIDNRYDTIEGVIKLYNNQVFIADNIKEVIPEYLMLLKGVIDCPDLPLNVSRSALQNDGFVKKISDYITKKVSDKLSGMFKTDRENYEKYWDDISPFIKYGCIKDTKFGDKMKDYILFKDLSDKYQTVEEYTGASKAEPEIETIPPEGQSADNADNAAAADNAAGSADTAQGSSAEDKKEKKNIYYVTDKKEQGQYVIMFKERGMNAVYLDRVIDTPFIGYMEQQKENISFVRIDADLTEEFKDTAEAGEAEKAKNDKLIALFRRVLANDKLDVKVEKLKDESIASMMTMSEEGRRMQEMLKMYAMYGMDDMGMKADDQTLVLNANNKLVNRLLENAASDSADPMNDTIAEQLYDMALLARGGLEAERMAAFIKRSQELMLKL